MSWGEQPSDGQNEDDDRRENHVGEFYTGIDDLGMGDIEFKHARPVHIKVAQQAVYFQNNPFRAASLKREREYTERIALFALPQSELTYVLLIRSGDKGEGNGRTYYIAQHGDLVEELPHLIENHGFEFSSLRGDYLIEDLPDELTAPYVDDDDQDSGDDHDEGSSALEV